MEWLYLDENGEIQFKSEEIKLVPQVQALLTLAYNKGKGDADGRKKVRAKQELKYLYLNYSTRSPYKDYSESERRTEALIDCNFPAEWEESEQLKALVPKFIKGTQTKFERLLSTSETVLDKIDDHLKSVNLKERDDKGAYVNDPKKIMELLKQLPGVAQTLQELEQQVKLGHVGIAKSKGDHELGWMALNTTPQAAQEEDEDNE